MKNLETGFELNWSDHYRGGKIHREWHAPCGCAYHPVPIPHIHPCDRHDEEDAVDNRRTPVAEEELGGEG